MPVLVINFLFQISLYIYVSYLVVLLYCELTLSFEKIKIKEIKMKKWGRITCLWGIALKSQFVLLNFNGKVPSADFFLFVVHQEVWTSSITLWETSQMTKWCQFQTGKTPVWAHVHTRGARQTHGAKVQVNTSQTVAPHLSHVSADIPKLTPETPWGEETH